MYEEILSKVDHTLLKQTATWQESREICDDAVKYGAASVCIPPSFVKQAAGYLKGRMRICTVIGFPNGYNTTQVKKFETEDAIANGADEIDMVVNLGDVKEGNWDSVREEIALLKRSCGDRVLKVIVETCLLTEEEKIAMCHIMTETGADYIKTSTGFAGEGATLEDVALFARHIGEHTKIKAAGGIDSLETARRFMELGASRLGTSRIIKLVKKEEKDDGGV